MGRITIFLLFIIACFGLLLLFSSKLEVPRQNRATSQSVLPKIVKKEQAHFEVRGSIPYWDQENAINSFKENVNAFSQVPVFWFYLDTEGSVKKYKSADIDSELIDFAHEQSIKISALIANLPEDGDWDSERVSKVIGTSSSRKKHIQEIVDLVNKYNFDGVSIDYEAVAGRERTNFSAFIKELSVALGRENKFLGVALHPKTSNSMGQYRFQDWEELAKYADELYIMSYGENYDEGSAGPIASLPWVKRIVDYTKSLNVPLEKFFLGIPLYGYDWNMDNDDAAEGLTYRDVLSLLSDNNLELEFDQDLASPHFHYEDESGDEHEVWFENAKSVEAKVRLAKDAGFGGVTFWRLGNEDLQVWEAVRKLK